MSGPISAADRAHFVTCRTMRELLRAIVEIDGRRLWDGDGARDCAHWLQMRYGISNWEAHRWIRAAHALVGLPRLDEALATGRLGPDKVLELCRFATPSREADLVAWAAAVSMATVRRRADAEARRTREELVEAERSRFLHIWYSDEGRRFGMEAELPAADGAIVERAIERLAREIPTMPGEEDEGFAGARRADALVAMAAARISGDPDPDRATLVVHAPLGALTSGEPAGGEVQDGPPVHAETMRRLLCSSRFQTVVEDAAGRVVRLGELSRLAPAWMLRQVRYRDRGCRFPGCGARRFTEAHHVSFWRHGGKTSLENLVLICAFHHRLVHEHGWTIERSADGMVGWRRPDGSEHLHGAPRVRGPTERLVA